MCHGRISLCVLSPLPIPALADLTNGVINWGCHDQQLEQKNPDSTGIMTPSAEIRQENRIKTLLSQEAIRKLGLEKMHRAMKAENSAEVKAEKIGG